MFGRVLNKPISNTVQQDENITIGQIDFTNSIASMQKSREMQMHKQQICNSQKSTEYHQLVVDLDSVVNESTPDIYFDIGYLISKVKSLIFCMSYMTYTI